MDPVRDDAVERIGAMSEAELVEMFGPRPTFEPVVGPTGEDERWMVRCLRGEIWTEGALRVVADVRWVLRERAANGLDSPPHVVEALAEGDRRHVLDPRRRLNIDTWSRDIEADPTTEALLAVRAAAGDPVAMAAAIAEALRQGVADDVVRHTVEEARHA
jgi:hypothetical protein